MELNQVEMPNSSLNFMTYLTDSLSFWRRRFLIPSPSYTHREKPMNKLKKHTEPHILMAYLDFQLFPSKIQRADLSQQMVWGLFKEEIISLHM